MENGLAPAKDGLLTAADLCRMFEEAEESTIQARADAERDRDYYDNIQLTAEELSALSKRKQPPMIDNRIKTKIDYLVGLEKQQRIDPRAMPRTPMHEEDATAASQALKYVADTEDFDGKRSGVWRNLLIEGSGGIRVYVEPSRKSYGAMMATTAMTPAVQFDIKLARTSWDRMFADPHSSELDFSDAGYLGLVVWMDYADALKQYGEEAREILDATMESAASSDTYDDKPKFNLWADRKRKRVRICQIWIKRSDEWYFAEYTKGGILKAGPSPYKTDTGESDCELFFQSAYVDRNNNRYGLVREMIHLQDGINKRGSKLLHLVNTAQIVYVEGAVDDIEVARREVQRPDGAVKVNRVGGDTIEQNFRVDRHMDVATAHFQLLQDSKNSIDLKGPNATMMGDKAQGSSAASGRAILASQQGGMIQLGDLMDNLRHLDKRVFRAIWNRIRQYWTAEKWVRTTDDENNVKWVGMNVDPMRLQMLAQDPRAAEMVSGVIGNVAELDCDIIIDEVPDSVTPQHETFQALVELKQMDQSNEIPFRAIIAAHPNMKDKSKLLEAMDKRQEEAAQSPQGQLQMRGAVAEVSEKEGSAHLKHAQAAKTEIEARLAPMKAAEDAMQGRAQIAQSGERDRMNIAQKASSDRLKATQAA